jgi:hypothetical protein
MRLTLCRDRDDTIGAPIAFHGGREAANSSNQGRQAVSSSVRAAARNRYDTILVCLLLAKLVRFHFLRSR